MEKEKIMLTEKGIVLCELWKLKNTLILIGIIIILLEVSLLILMLLK